MFCIYVCCQFYGLEDTVLPGYHDKSFLATFSVNDLDPTNPIVFDVTRLNPGGHYDNTTGIYTVPLDGIYQVIFHIRSYDDAVIYPRLVIDGILVMYFLSLHQFWFLNNQIAHLKPELELV